MVEEQRLTREHRARRIGQLLRDRERDLARFAPMNLFSRVSSVSSACITRLVKFYRATTPWREAAIDEPPLVSYLRYLVR